MNSKLMGVIESEDTLKREAIAEACAEYNFKWPKELWTGVMFWRGERITIDEFNAWAKKFK